MRLRALLLLLALATSARAEVPAERFLAEAFGTMPAQQMLWLTPPLKERAAKILDHAYAGMRVKYWRAGRRTAWILDEIGKEQPITVGILVDDGRIGRVEILAFRESRGGEVRHGFFTRQFVDARLQAGDRLDRKVDGITGATLSVWAVTRVSRLALVFHEEALRHD
ncbi:MAG: FMN-binding protein [Gammaproteobacteria bacterium]